MRHAYRLRNLGLALLALAGAGCNGGQSHKGTDDPGQPVGVSLGDQQQQEVDRLQAVITAAKATTAPQMLERRAVPFRTTLGYDPSAAVNLNLIQASALSMNAAELAALNANGFVISDRNRYPHFAYGYRTIYGQDLPVFISADSVLEAVHRSYDAILKGIEIEALIPETKGILTAMRANLGGAPAGGAPAGGTGGGGLSETARQDADLLLAVGLSLLQDGVVGPVAGADGAEISRLYQLAKAATGSQGLQLFGVTRDVDLSQFKPRGHYADDPILSAYFRAMIWLGRIDFPMLETDGGDGSRVLRRRSIEDALALRALMDPATFQRWTRVDATVRAFVGEPDSMSPADVDRLKSDLGVTGTDLGGISDDMLARTLVAGAYGAQKILSQIVMQAPHDGPWPLDATFLFFGQKYVFDSHVFSNVVYDRVGSRMMPNPLDAAYAALGNDQAAGLLRPELEQYSYAGALESMRRLGDEHGATFWDANLYNLWLGALRTLSPGSDLTGAASGLPTVATTERWGRRLLSTQLASWAELRHDTILYAKQSYTTGVVCEFPDAYVEPYPAFFAQIEKLAAAGEAVVAQLPIASGSYLAEQIKAYFAHLGEVAGILRGMAENQRTGLPHTAEHLAFINRAVTIQEVCGGPGTVQGWYADLFFEPNSKFDPTIADVHTQPTDLAGNFVGKVLHVGTGLNRLMIMTVDTCAGPRAYAGVVSTYHEVITENLQRLNDNEWAERVQSQTPPPDVPWMSDLVVK